MQSVDFAILVVMAGFVSCSLRNPNRAYRHPYDGAPAEHPEDGKPAVDVGVKEVGRTESGLPDATVSASDVPPPKGLAAYWRADEGAGTFLSDSSGNGNSGMLSGAVTWRAGGFPAAGFANPYALDFDGQGGVATIKSTAPLTNLSTMTLAAWIRPRGGGSSGLGRIITKRQTGVAGWQIHTCGFSASNGCPNDMRLSFVHAFSKAEGKWSSPGGVLKVDTWQHVAVTYEVALGRVPAVYLDGVGVQLAEASPSGDPPDDAAEPITIGNAVSLDRGFDGMIDDVRVYDRVLSAAEIADLSAGKP